MAQYLLYPDSYVSFYQLKTNLNVAPRPSNDKVVKHL